MLKLKSIVTCLGGAILLFISASAAHAVSASPQKTLQKHDLFHTFSGELSAELAIAKQQNKTGLLLFFSTQHCPFCQRMRKNVFNQAAVQLYFRSHFQLIEIDIESDKTLNTQQQKAISYKAYTKTQRIRLTPTIIFLDTNGEKLYQHTGIIANPTEFLWLGEYIEKSHSSQLSFAHFKANKRKEAHR